MESTQKDVDANAKKEARRTRASFNPFGIKKRIQRLQVSRRKSQNQQNKFSEDKGNLGGTKEDVQGIESDEQNRPSESKPHVDNSSEFSDYVVVDSGLETNHQSFSSSDDDGPGTHSPSVPLSQASATDRRVYNDILKVVIIGSSLGEKSWLTRTLVGSKESKQETSAFGINVLEGITWNDMPSSDSENPIKFTIWDVSVRAGSRDVDANLHVKTQSVFFSSSTLYILVWDLACNNPKTDISEYNDSVNNDTTDEKAIGLADMALQADIYERVLPWVNCVAQHASNVILPVAVVPEGMNESEVKRRCDAMQKMLKEHTSRPASQETAPTLLEVAGGISLVGCGEGIDIEHLRETILAAATGPSTFSHVGAEVSRGTLLTLEAIRQFKRDGFDIIEVSTLLSAVGQSLPEGDIYPSLRFLSTIGEILYFGSNDARDDNDAILGRYVVLSSQWMVPVLSCVLRENVKQGLKATRHVKSDLRVSRGHDMGTSSKVIEMLVGDETSNCPLMSSKDVELLWISNRFMQKAADRCCQMTESSEASQVMFWFLERVLVQAGLLVPLESSLHSTSKHSNVYFLSGCLSEPADWCDIWTYKTRESWKTTLCHSLPIHDAMLPLVMEEVTVTLLRNLYNCLTKHGDLSASDSHFETKDSRKYASIEAVGPVKIHQVMCWKSCLMLKIGMIYEDLRSGEPLESSTEIFIAIVDRNSALSVASESFGTNARYLVVSGKGAVGNNCRQLWNGGYRFVLDSVRESFLLSRFEMLDYQVACPECLAHLNPRDAKSWSLDSVSQVAKSGDPTLYCNSGHRIDSRVLRGEGLNSKELVAQVAPTDPSSRSIGTEIFPCVVLIGVWNSDAKKIVCVGSGFVADAKLGFVITSAHIPFCMAAGHQFGCRFSGTVVIGVIPRGQDQVHAEFRYLADVVAADICYVDACVLRIQNRLAHGLDEVDPGHTEDLAVEDENLASLSMTKHIELEEGVRIVGFNADIVSGATGRANPFTARIDYGKGYVLKRFCSPSSGNEDVSSSKAFEPREEIVVERCYTAAGYAGGPCINDRGEVVGILSRVDPVDPGRCYVVPTSELIGLVNLAMDRCLSTHGNTIRRDRLSSDEPASLDISRNVNAGEERFNQRDLDGALSYYHKALEISEWLTPDSLPLAALYCSIGRVLAEQGDLEGALREYRKALEIQERLAPDSLLTAHSYSHIGNVLVDRGDLAGAMIEYRRAFAIQERWAPDSLSLAHSCYNIGRVLAEQGDMEGAWRMYSRALAIQERLVPDSLITATLYSSIGSVLEVQDELDGALREYEKAVRIRELLAPNSMDMAASCSDIGGILQNRGDLEGALGEYHKALGIQERIAPNSLSVAESHVNIGRVLAEQGDLEGALTNFRRALVIHERLVPETLTMASLRSNVASVYKDQGDLAGALREYRSALVIAERLLPDSLTVAHTCNNIGTVIAEQGDFEGALREFRKALAIKECVAPGSVGVATTSENIGRLLAGAGDAEGALAEFCHALSIRERQTVPDSLLEAELHLEIGTVVLNQGDLATAMKCLMQAKSMLLDPELRLWATDPRILYCTLKIGEIQLARNEFDLALDNAKDILAVAPEYDQVYVLKGKAHFGLGDFAAAIESFDEALRRSPDESVANDGRLEAELALAKQQTQT